MHIIDLPWIQFQPGFQLAWQWGIISREYFASGCLNNRHSHLTHVRIPILEEYDAKFHLHVALI